MGVALGLLGAQLSIAGAILYHSQTAGGDQDNWGGLLLIIGILLGVVAVIQGRKGKLPPS